MKPLERFERIQRENNTMSDNSRDVPQPEIEEGMKEKWKSDREGKRGTEG